MLLVVDCVFFVEAAYCYMLSRFQRAGTQPCEWTGALLKRFDNAAALECELLKGSAVDLPVCLFCLFVCLPREC